MLTIPAGVTLARIGQHRRIGRWAVLAAAYAFVLNAMLASFLLAAVPVSAFASDNELCITHVSGDAGQTSIDGATKRLAVHCKLCCPGLAAVIPPPATPTVFARVAVSQPQQVAYELRLKQFFRFSHASPRGPPALI